MIYNFRNLQIIDCTNFENGCERISDNLDATLDTLRGGSPFVKFFDTNYYVSFSYTHLRCTESRSLTCHIYRPALIILKAVDESKPETFKVIYESEPFDFNKELFDFEILEGLGVITMNNGLRNNILIVASINSWDYRSDRVYLTININDKYPLVVKVQGLGKFIFDIIKKDEKNQLPSSHHCAQQFAREYYESFYSDYQLYRRYN